MKAQVQQPKTQETIQPKAEKQAPISTILSEYNSPLQRKATEDKEPLQKKANNTGLPDNLKSGIENLSGHSMDDVKVHYGSSKPAELQAHAYAQGSDIHVAPGQEKHLPHEAWHVVQQKQGRVKPTMQMKGKVNINDDTVLETEADVMGAKSLQMKQTENNQFISDANTNSVNIYQLIVIAGKRKKAVEKWAGDKAQDVIDWFETDEDMTGIDAALEMKFSDWWKNVHENDGSAPKVVAANPYTEVNAKINASPYDIAKFTSADKDEVIKNEAASKNWTTSIKSVYDSITAREEKALRDARIAKFQSAKTAGDAIFTAGLAKAIWDATWSVFTSPAPKNTTLAISYSDAAIGVAVAAWTAQASIAPTVPGGGNQSINNIHVPGAPNHYIEDKSTRAHNPDPNRGRQADFKSTWGALDINIHVNSTVPH